MRTVKIVKVLQVPVDSDAAVIGVNSDLDSLKAAIGGGWLELFGPTEPAGVGWAGYCDEEGKITGLPINARATLLARYLGWNTGDVLNGTVVFLGTGDDEGEDTDVETGVLAAATLLGYLP